jgi:hypothetical protein
MTGQIILDTSRFFTHPVSPILLATDSCCSYGAYRFGSHPTTEHIHAFPIDLGDRSRYSTFWPIDSTLKDVGENTTFAATILRRCLQQRFVLIFDHTIKNPEGPTMRYALTILGSQLSGVIGNSGEPLLIW